MHLGIPGYETDARYNFTTSSDLKLLKTLKTSLESINKKYNISLQKCSIHSLVSDVQCFRKMQTSQFIQMKRQTKKIWS